MKKSALTKMIQEEIKSLNESASNSPAYWHNYADGGSISTGDRLSEVILNKYSSSYKDVVAHLHACINLWNEESDQKIYYKDIYNYIIDEMWDYVMKYKKINGHVISAMIMQSA